MRMPCTYSVSHILFSLTYPVEHDGKVVPALELRRPKVSVTHRLTRSGGSETSLELKQPQGNAGKDRRKSKSSSVAARLGAAITADPYATPEFIPPGLMPV